MSGLASYYRAVALDYDGTIAFGGPPSDAVLASIRALRDGGRKVLLVTGRIIAELAREFPAFERHFDLVVAENGAVLHMDGRDRVLSGAVSPALVAALEEQKVPFRRGRAILALAGTSDASVRDSCVRLGLDDQLVRNRGELMVLPAGVSKASGVREGLAELGISVHNTIAVGDAENDLSMLECCEVGVATGDAVASLKARADLVVPEPGADALARFLDADLAERLATVETRRHRVVLGASDDGSFASVAASQAQVFVDGSTGAGKSYLAGLFIEGLVRQSYTVTVLDFEGDHVDLGHLRGILTLGGHEPLPPPSEVARLVRHRFSSVVLDLSVRDPHVRAVYARDVLQKLVEARRDCALPHWIVVEEAHTIPGDLLAQARESGNLCLVTYHPDWLPSYVVRAFDYLITVEAQGRARLRSGPSLSREQWFTPGAREVRHVRHRHKYAESSVDYERGFTFRNANGAIGQHVTSLASFADELAGLPPDWLEHHAAHRDFSRWIRDVFQDPALFGAVRDAEERFRVRDVESFRALLQSLIKLRYGIDDARVDALDAARG